MRVEASFYDSATGLFTGATFRGPDDLLAMNTPPGCTAAAGRFDRLSQRVNLQTGQVEDYQPEAPPDDELRTWAWDEAAKRWLAVPTDAAVAIDVRTRRDTLLAACDWVTVRAVELDDVVPAGWAAYRAALRDVPQQPGFPRTVEWPAAPAA